MQRLLALGLLAVLPATSMAATLWKGDFETGDLSQWSKTQQVSRDRLLIVESPVREGRYAIKATVKQGDDPIGASGNRNELLNTTLTPEGSEYYYRWSTLFPEDYPTEHTWQVFTQWHQSGCCGVPPVEFDINGDRVKLTLDNREVWSTPLVRGTWHDFIFHVKWSNNPKVGFVELWYDGELVLPKMHARTTSQTYLKQGLYRNSSISRTAHVYHDGMIQATRLEDVLPPAPGPTKPEPQVSTGQPAPGGAPATPPTSTGAANGSDPSPSSSPSSKPTYPTVTGGAGPYPAEAGGCSTSGTAGLSLLALGAAAWLLGRRRPVRVPVRFQRRR